MQSIRISSYQGPLSDCDIEANITKVKSVLKEQAKNQCDFLLFPEVFLTGYSPKAVREYALTLNDPRLLELIAYTKAYDTVLLVGISEKEGDDRYNVQLVIYRGELVGKQYKTMLTQGYDNQLFKTKLDLPVFCLKGIRFGIAICHTTSFVEPALILNLKGAQLLFTPHFNNLPPEVHLPDGRISTFSDHRNMVLSNQAGLAALLKMTVVRSNIVQSDTNALGSGDSNIWDYDGQLLAAGKPFTECVVSHSFPMSYFSEPHPMINRMEVPFELYREIYMSAKQRI